MAHQSYLPMPLVDLSTVYSDHWTLDFENSELSYLSTRHYTLDHGRSH